MPNYRRYKSSITSNTNTFGIMGGLANRRRVGTSSMNRATSRLVIPTKPLEGMQFMRKHNILSRNPQCSGGVGRAARTSCRCCDYGKFSIKQDTLGDTLGVQMKCIATDLSSLQTCLSNCQVVTVSGPITIDGVIVTINKGKTVKILNNSGFSIKSTLINKGKITAYDISKTHSRLYKSIIYNDGSFNNGGDSSSNGTIDISMTGGSGNSGIYTYYGTFNNGEDGNGKIDITMNDGSGNYGIYNYYGTFNNGDDSSSNGKIDITMNDGSGNYGIYNNDGSFYNGDDSSSNGTIDITMNDGSGNYGIYNDYGYFYNGDDSSSNGTIDISMIGGSGNSGIYNYDGTFNNGDDSSSNGTIVISMTDGLGNYGIYNYDGTFNNGDDSSSNGTIDISMIGGSGNSGIYNYDGTFNNGDDSSSNGTIDITMNDCSGNYGIYNYYGYFYNGDDSSSNGKIVISMTDGLGNYGIYNNVNGYFYNGKNGNGTIDINMTTDNIKYAISGKVYTYINGTININNQEMTSTCIGISGETGWYVNTKLGVYPYCCINTDNQGRCTDADNMCISDSIRSLHVKEPTCLTKQDISLCTHTSTCFATSETMLRKLADISQCETINILKDISLNGKDLSLNGIGLVINENVTFTINPDVSLNMGSVEYNSGSVVFGTLTNNGTIIFDNVASYSKGLEGNSGTATSGELINNGKIQFKQMDVSANGIEVYSIAGSGTVCGPNSVSKKTICSADKGGPCNVTRPC